MKLTELLLSIFALQGFAIFFDEFYFHWRRGLPLWERLGHPLDTATVLIPFVFALAAPYSASTLPVFVGLAVFSCLFITKDEFVHQKHCSGAENWLHAVLFILHPLAFIVAGMIWAEQRFVAVLTGQTLLISLFLGYQIVYWSFLWPRKTSSTTTSTTNSAIVGTPPTTIPSRFFEPNQN